MDDDALVDFSVRDGVGWITLTKGDSGNAFGTPMGVELLAAVMAAEEADVPVLVVSATGRFFCVGGDLREFGAEDEPALLIDELAHMLNRIVSRLKSLDAVVISAVQGGAAGAGLGLAAAADLVIAAESASFTLAYTKAGLSPDGGGTLLAESVGLHRALALALLNPVWSAEDALAAGLVTQVVPDAELLDQVTALAGRLARGSRTAQAATKHLIRGNPVPSDGRVELEARSISALAGSPDGREGVQAFLAKRRPEFPSATS